MRLPWHCGYRAPVAPTFRPWEGETTDAPDPDGPDDYDPPEVTTPRCPVHGYRDHAVSGARLRRVVLSRRIARPLGSVPMPNLSKLTSGELIAAKNATDYLTDLHQKHGALDPDLWSKLDTFSA